MVLSGRIIFKRLDKALLDLMLRAFASIKYIYSFYDNFYTEASEACRALKDESDRLIAGGIFANRIGLFGLTELQSHLASHEPPLASPTSPSGAESPP